MNSKKAGAGRDEPVASYPSMQIGLLAFRRRFPHLSAQATVPSRLAGNGEPHLKGAASWLMPNWELFHLAGTSTMSLEAIADKLGMDIQRVRELLYRVGQVAAISTIRGRKARRIEMLCEERGVHNGIETIVWWPRKPRSAGLRIAQQYESYVSVLANTDIEFLQLVLGYYVRHVWRTTCYPIFHDPSQPMEAIRYVRLLENLGIEKSSLRFLHFNPMLRSPYRARWKSVLGLSWRHRSQVIFINPPFRRSASSDRWLAILPPFHAAPEERASDLLKGFHFLMVMAAIVYGFRSS